MQQLLILFILMKEAIIFSAASVLTSATIHHIQEDAILQHLFNLSSTYMWVGDAVHCPAPAVRGCQRFGREADSSD
jgi:hypothetical protein